MVLLDDLQVGLEKLFLPENFNWASFAVFFEVVEAGRDVHHEDDFAPLVRVKLEVGIQYTFEPGHHVPCCFVLALEVGVISIPKDSIEGNDFYLVADILIEVATALEVCFHLKKVLKGDVLNVFRNVSEPSFPQEVHDRGLVARILASGRDVVVQAIVVAKSHHHWHSWEATRDHLSDVLPHGCDHVKLALGSDSILADLVSMPDEVTSNDNAGQLLAFVFDILLRLVEHQLYQLEGAVPILLLTVDAQVCVVHEA